MTDSERITRLEAMVDWLLRYPPWYFDNSSGFHPTHYADTLSRNVPKRPAWLEEAKMIQPTDRDRDAPKKPT